MMRLRHSIMTVLALAGGCRQEGPLPDAGRLDAIARRYVVLGLSLLLLRKQAR